MESPFILTAAVAVRFIAAPAVILTTPAIAFRFQTPARAVAFHAPVATMFVYATPF